MEQREQVCKLVEKREMQKANISAKARAFYLLVIVLK